MALSSVSHPSEWPFGGYNEFQKPRRKCVLIYHQKLARLTGFEICDAFRKVHLKLVTESLVDGNNSRQAHWSESIVVGNEKFVKKINENLGLRAKVRKILENDGGFQLREEGNTCHVNSRIKNGNIEGENVYCWDVNNEC